MSRGVLFVEEAPVIEIMPQAVRVTTKSGDEVFVRVLERDTWRRFLETEMARLLECERSERMRVVPFKPGGSRRKH